MENEKQSSIRRRPLPNAPASASASSGDVAAPKPVAAVCPEAFYSDPPPTLPRRIGHGSSFTRYTLLSDSNTPEADENDPPSYEAITSAAPSQESWRSPLLIEDSKNDELPPLVTDFQDTRGRSPAPVQAWADESWSVQSKIEGRSIDEELNWWDRETLAQMQRPGRGMLPTLVAELLHNPQHTLFHVIVTPPEWQGPASQLQGGSPASSSIVLPLEPLTKEDVLEAVPNAHAVYSPKENGWLLLHCRQFNVLPPLAPQFIENNTGFVPRKSHMPSCTDDIAFQSNLTHHYHLYPKSVSAGYLNYTPRAWEESKSSSSSSMQVDSDDKMEGIEQSTPGEDLLLDMYVCCQCATFVLVSNVIPGIIPSNLIETFVRDRMEHPLPAQKQEDAAAIGLETIIKILENLLWKNELRAVPLTPGKAFANKVGVTNIAMELFTTLGFCHNNATSFADASLGPPAITRKSDRDRLLRAWVELGAWYQDFVKRHPVVNKPAKLCVAIESARDSYLSTIGARLEGIMHEPLRTGVPWPTNYVTLLGFTLDAYSPDIVEFAYRAQCRCDPPGTPYYFEALNQFNQIHRTFLETLPQSLETLYLNESDRGRWTPSEVTMAADQLGFGRSNALKVELDESEDEFVFRAWEDLMTRAWQEEGGGALRRKELTRALNVIAEFRGSRFLKSKASESYVEMTPERAYSTLEVPSDVDEEMLITVYKMRLDETPSSTKKMKDALMAIAKTRGSSRLHSFLETGQDPGQAVQTFHPEWPRGLNQLGNTCYLNSLLQYFYTIKELRTALMPEAVPPDMKLSDDDLKRHRVGGRLVTRREITRARKFVAGLANLFSQLEYSAGPAVTPELELAKLALVTSKDEEEDEHGRTEVGTDSSADTDATLVDESPITIGPSPATHSSASPTGPGSVLGKRQRNRGNSAFSMDVDSAGGCDRDEFVLVNDDSRRELMDSESALTPKKNVETKDATEVKDQKENKPPPLPPRRKPDVNSESVMMFGKQHDVAECMDNCMFQIETALLRFDDLATTDKDKTSVVKRLFFGKIRQRITPLEHDISGRGSSVHEKEDMFSHLPVNVSEESFDIYDGLSAYFDDIVDFQGRKMKMEVSLVDLPPILQIQLQRVQFNRDTLQPYKSHAYVRFSETLFVDRFLDSVDQTKRAQAKSVQLELNVCRDRIHALTRNKHPLLIDSFSQVHDFLLNQDIVDLDIDEELLAHLQTELRSVQNELVELRTKAARLKEELETIWVDEKNMEYELTSVFVHRGSSPSWGHYFFYSRCLPHNPDMWFKYNDSEVTLVKQDEVLADTTGSTANPYLLVYARKGMDMVQTVHRTDSSMA